MENSGQNNDSVNNIDTSIKDIIVQLRSNLATIRSFLHFLEIGQYKATEKELREMHSKLDSHLEKSQDTLVKKLEDLADICSNKQDPN